MKVAMICQPWDPMRPPVTAGSVAIWVYEVSTRLVEAGCEVTIYAQQSEGDLASEQHGGVDFRRRPLGRTGRSARLQHRLLGRPSPRRPFFASRFFCDDFIAKVARDIRDRNVDVVHIQNYSQFVPVVRRFNPDARIILHMRCEWLLQLDRDMLRERLAHADLVLSVGRYLTKATRDRFADVDTTFATLGEGIDTNRYKPAASPLCGGEERHMAYGIWQTAKGKTGEQRHNAHSSLLPSPPTVLFVSRISPEKGVHTLIKAFARVLHARPTARLRIVGPPGGLEPEFMLELSDDPLIHNAERYFRGNYLAMLKQELTVPDSQFPVDDPRTENHGSTPLSDAVEFVGHVPHSELPGEYQRAALLALPSISEAFGRTVIEAMACGVPVVGSCIGGIAETVTHGETGLLVPPENPDALADTLIDLLDDHERRQAMGARARQRVCQMYTWESITEQTRAYYEDRVGEGTDGRRGHATKGADEHSIP